MIFLKQNALCLKSLFIIGILIFTIRSEAQRSNTLFFMHSLPQANLTNPAVQIPCKVFVGFPLLSSVHTNYSNTYFTYRDLIQNDNGTIDLNPDYLLKSPGTLQQMDIEFHISLINFGFLYKDYYFNFNLQDKLDFGIGYPTDFFQLLLKGNASYIGKSLDLSGAEIFANYYREWAFGVSKIMNKNLTLGVKAKILFGKANISTSQSDISLFTNDNIYYLDLRSQLEVRASPVVLNIASNGRLNSIRLPEDASVTSLLLNRKNKGFAIDFGFIYDNDDRFVFSGSLLDLGFIRYTYSPAIVNEIGEYTYTGLPNTPNAPIAEILSNLQFEVRNSYLFTNNSRSYTHFLPPKIYLGATYKLRQSLNTGLMTRNEYYNSKLRSSATASLNAVYKKYFTGSLSWSYINGSPLNFGLGLGARTPNFGIYAISDNVYGVFKYKSTRLINLRFGINLLFGCKSCNNIAAAKYCAAYKDVDENKIRFARWLEKRKKEKKKRL